MSIVINTDDAERVRRELEAAHARLVAEVRTETIKAGNSMRDMARVLAQSRSMPDLAGSIGARVSPLVDGVTVTIEARSPFGYIREFGAGRSGPHPFMLPALEAGLDPWEQGMSAVADRAV